MAVLLILLLIIVCVAIPLGYSVRIWRLEVTSRFAWFLAVAQALLVCLLVLLLGRWDMAGIHTRWLLALIFLIAILLSWRRHHVHRWRGARQASNGGRASLLSLIFFGAALAWILYGSFARHDPVMLDFPLTGGRFVVAQGGGNRLLNYHHSHGAQRYAFDITAVSATGFRASGLLPAELSRYVIFDKPVISPCDGDVLEVQDGLPDQAPPRADPDHAAGNHAIIQCGKLKVTLAHLRRGSVRVSAGEQVVTGGAIGNVGNSGNTSEPHLHIHATDAGGKAVQIGFSGRLPVRNSVFRR